MKSPNRVQDLVFLGAIAFAVHVGFISSNGDIVHPLYSHNKERDIKNSSSIEKWLLFEPELIPHLQNKLDDKNHRQQDVIKTQSEKDSFEEVQAPAESSRVLSLPTPLSTISSNRKKRFRWIKRDKMQRRILLPLRLLAALLRLLLLPLRILLAPVILLLRAILQLLRLLLRLLNPFFFIFLLIQAFNIAANIARLILMILRIVFRRLRRREKEEKDDEEIREVITLDEGNHRVTTTTRKPKKHKKHHHKHGSHHRRVDSSATNIDNQELFLVEQRIFERLTCLGLLSRFPNRVHLTPENLNQFSNETYQKCHFNNIFHSLTPSQTHSISALQSRLNY